MAKTLAISLVSSLLVFYCAVTNGNNSFPMDVAEKAFEITMMFRKLLLSFKSDLFQHYDPEVVPEEWLESQRDDIIASGVDETLDYITNYGDRIAFLLSFLPNRRIWWLWQHSMFANSVAAVLQPDRVTDYVHYLATDSAVDKLRSVQVVNINLVDSLKIFIRKRNRRFAMNFFEDWTTEAILQALPAELDKFDLMISQKYGGITDGPTEYKAINMYMHHKADTVDRIGLLMSKSAGFDWSASNEVIKENHLKAAVVWVCAHYEHLKLYYDMVLFVLKVSVYGHLKKHIVLSSIELENLGADLKQDPSKRKYSTVNKQWVYTNNLLTEFIGKFDLYRDDSIMKLSSLFGKNKFRLSAILELLNKELGDMMPQIRVTEYEEQDTEASDNELDYMDRIIQNNNELQQYMTLIVSVFSSTNFSNINIFFECVPVKNVM